MKRLTTLPSLLACTATLLISSCSLTSLSNPGGSGHGRDLSLYELTGDRPDARISEKDIANALGGRSGSLPPRGGKILLVQSGAHQPDEELTAAFHPLCQSVAWTGQSPETVPENNNSHSSSSNEKNADRAAADSKGLIGRRLRLIAAQQGCSHVVVVFGEIQSASKDTASGAMIGWLPVVGNLVPAEHSGSRLFAQALVLETASPRYSIITASPREESGFTTSGGENSAQIRRSLRLKKLIYPELAGKCFR